MFNSCRKILSPPLLSSKNGESAQRSSSQTNHCFDSRFVIGAAQALSNATALMSVGEISSPEIRGTLTVIYQIFMNVGVVAPSIISVLFSSYKTLAWGVTFFSILSLLSMYWATETPHFLVAVSKPKQAKNILKQIRQGYPEDEINNEFEKSQKYIEDEKTRKSELNWLTFIQSKSIRKPILSGILMNFFALLTGAQFIRFYITAIIPSNDNVPVKYYPLANQILLLALSGITAWYVEKFPRRYMFLLGASAMVLINAFCAISHHFTEEYRDEDVFKWMFALGNILVLVCYGTSIQPMTNTLNSELYPQAIKGFCGSLATMSQALSLVILFQLYRFINDHFHLYLMYTVCSLSSIVLYLVVYFLLPEGRGAFLSDLQMKFKEGSLPACS
ncbi:uncharacterized protein LOC135836408 isoform X4 [Planococcus citri]|uniref:uncharacterized protein LOC135836408 isoform X4 n=1 Tax=Planococcus citri TaxID=170843 RepID=UPI0031F8E5B7